MEEKKLEYGGFIEVTMEDMKEIHHAPTVDEVIKALECCKSKEKKCKECPLHEFGSGCLDVLIANSHCIVQIWKSEMDRKTDVIDWLCKDIESLRTRVDDTEERLSAKQNELWNLQDDFDNLLAEGTKKVAQELLQDLFYFLDGNSFWLKETGDKVHYVKLDDALEFMRKKAKQYFVEVEE